MISRYLSEGAHIHISNKFDLTNADGRYRFANLRSGRHRILVTYIGFKSLDTIISLDQDAEVNFQLKEERASLETVILKSIQRRTSSENIIRVSDTYLQEQFDGSLANTLEKLPGINAMEIGAGASKPIIRGLGFNRVAVTENGIKQEGQQWGADHGLEIDAFSVEDVEIIKGVGAIEHGSEAIGGVIKIINDNVPPEGFSGEILGLAKSINNTLATSINLSFRPEKFYFKIKATGSEFGDYSVPTDNIVYLTRNIPIYNERVKNSAGKEIDLYGQAGYLGEHYKSTLSISNVYFKAGFFPGAHGIPSLSRVQDDGDRRNITYPFQRVNHFKIIQKNEWFYHDHSWEVILGIQNNHRQEWSRFHTHYSAQSAPEFNPDLELDFNLNTYDAQLKLNKDWNPNHSSTFGAQAQFQDNNISGFNFLLPEYLRSDLAIYTKHTYQVSENLILSLGTRLNQSSIAIEKFHDTNLYNYLLENGLV
ncbi:TonB-dependent receptor [Antarcticibacterium sp. 1MA-6-2]|uniref:TonB-dependent receptor plug domain-containing protein n=1 Tax=Antarcticibacterium sp. 1MA-6-2 TaxID=2908210 RepID=UPI001F3ABE1B|nr:TonB-dependent receptor plug domain-containing protein [Antarcticibacterium sp. 1MA-6-2]UJH91701.1 TonB-dependent receptor [Antarcticibacterium sp. 1MA-6-2]